MASLKDKKLSPALFLLSGQDTNVMMVVVMVMMPMRGAGGGAVRPLCPAACCERSTSWC